jgi:hypothetical protein
MHIVLDFFRNNGNNRNKKAIYLQPEYKKTLQ